MKLDPKCFGSDGSVEVQIFSGISPYNIKLWEFGTLIDSTITFASDYTFPDVPVGTTYWVSVKAGNGNDTNTVAFDIAQPLSPLKIESIIATQIQAALH